MNEMRQSDCRRGTVVLVGAILAGLSVWVGCESARPTMPPREPPAVTVAVPIARDLQDFEEFTGRAEASQFVQIRARVGGYLDKIFFKPGTFIEEGAPLFEIDPRPYQTALEQAEGVHAQAQARLERLKQDLVRAKDLVSKKVMPAQEYDKIVGDNVEAVAAIKTADAAIDAAKLNLTFTKVNAPIGGLVSREMITVGNLVRADDTMLTTIAACDPVHVYYDIDEAIVLRIRRMIREGTFKSARENKLTIRMALGDSEGFPYEGFVNFVDNRLDPATGTMKIRGEFPNPKLENNALAITPGMFARVRLNLGDPVPGLLVAQKAVVTDQGKKVVLTVDDQNIVHVRPVVVGKLFPGGLVAIKEGLKANERIVVIGVQRARPGTPVNPTPKPMDEIAL